jgi:hypothetical protein
VGSQIREGTKYQTGQNSKVNGAITSLVGVNFVFLSWLLSCLGFYLVGGVFKLFALLGW